MQVVAKSDGKRDVLLLGVNDTVSSVSRYFCQIGKVTGVDTDDILKNCELSGASMWEVNQIVESVKAASSKKGRGCSHETNYGARS